MSYWKDRMAKSQDKMSKKNIKEIEEQLKKYYGNAAKKVIADFESTYNKVLAQHEDGKEVTPADLYKLDKYWQMQGQMRQELQKLGEKQIALLTKQFEINFFDVYYSIGIQGAEAFSTIDKTSVEQLINQIWCADGKSWSQRIWGNTERLAETLNEQLVNIVASGSKSDDLKRILQNEFNVSFSRADALVRTEIAHVQTQAAKQRYKDYGIGKVQIWADEDERRCPECGKLHMKIYNIGEDVPIPRHPRCRCTIIPVIDDNERNNKVMESKKYEITETEKEQLDKIYKANPELKNQMAEAKYRNEQYIYTRESRIKMAQSALDGERTLDSFIRQEGLMKWDGRKNAMVVPKNAEQVVKDYQEKLKKESEKIKEAMAQREQRVLHSYIFCVDCGEPILIEGKKTNAQKRCPECQANYRKKYKALKEQERRAKKKK